MNVYEWVYDFGRFWVCSIEMMRFFWPKGQKINLFGIYRGNFPNPNHKWLTWPRPTQARKNWPNPGYKFLTWTLHKCSITCIWNISDYEGPRFTSWQQAEIANSCKFSCQDNKICYPCFYNIKTFLIRGELKRIATSFAIPSHEQFVVYFLWIPRPHCEISIKVRICNKTNYILKKFNLA